MNVKDLQDLVRHSHDQHFGSTTLKERLRDLQNEVAEIVHYRNDANLREEVGDTGWSLLQLCNEQGIDFTEAVRATLGKLDSRATGKKVALIEKRRIVGGVCLETGTIPSKTFREAVRAFLAAARHDRFPHRRGVAQPARKAGRAELVEALLGAGNRFVGQRRELVDRIELGGRLSVGPVDRDVAQIAEEPSGPVGAGRCRD